MQVTGGKGITCTRGTGNESHRQHHGTLFHDRTIVTGHHRAFDKVDDNLLVNTAREKRTGRFDAGLDVRTIGALQVYARDLASLDFIDDQHVGEGRALSAISRKWVFSVLTMSTLVLRPACFAASSASEAWVRPSLAKRSIVSNSMR